MAPTARPARSDPAPSDATPIHVLLAEDDRDFRALVTSALARAGFCVTAVADGRQLVEHLGTAMLTHFKMPDVVVADIRMPGPSGIEVTGALEHVHSTMPIILMTAFGDQRAHEDGERAGAVAVLDKPFEMRSLIDLIQRTARQ